MPATAKGAPGTVPPASERRGSIRVFLIAGEPSGDRLGGPMMAALKEMDQADLEFAGVGGTQMAEQGLTSIFPLSDVAVMGPLAIAARLPRLIRRVYQTIDAALSAEPDVVVLIDSPEFTHPIGKRIRKRRPEIPIIDYVSPQIWAWRQGRARRMRTYIDHILALLPFEPDELRRLGGPSCTYVGHPLVDRLPWIDSLDVDAFAKRTGLDAERPIVVLLPGSRSSEVTRLLDPFARALAQLETRIGPIQTLLPVADHLRPLVEDRLANLPLDPLLVEGEADKFSAFRLARGALAASGTATLEVALTGTPMVVGYRVEPLASRAARLLIKVPSVVLANLVLGHNAIPELLQEECTPDRLSEALEPLLTDSDARAAQCDALKQIRSKIEQDGMSPSREAAGVVMAHARGDARHPPQSGG